MLVYGDAQDTLDPRDQAELVCDLSRRAEVQALPVERHGLRVRALVAASGLVQGLADAEAAADGCDEPGPATATALALLAQLGARVVASWDGAFAPRFEPIADLPRGTAWPDTVTIRRPEGHAFYALYPEAYAAAARQLSTPPEVVIGLRSIGCGLAVVAAEAAGGRPLVVTLRPGGDAFARTVRPGPTVARDILDRKSGLALVVDEGPGFSGSSFGAVADWLEDNGWPRDRIAFLPGHDGALGPAASPRHRERWGQAFRPVVPFEDLLAGDRDPRRFTGWFDDLIGRLDAPPVDVAGGRWRDVHASPGEHPPADPARERRKWLVAARGRRYLLRFAGLDEVAARNVARWRTLAEAGFCNPPLALRHGLTVESWLEDVRPLDQSRALHDPAVLARVADYLAFRRQHCPARRGSGASPAQLLVMIERNAGLALGEEAAAALAFRWRPAVGSLAAASRPIVTDNRLHRREWLVLPDGRILKTDAVDHAFAHDLVGCQDIAWDLAGAMIEFGWDADRGAELARRVVGHVTHPDLLAFHRLAYAAFHLGLATLAREAAYVSSDARTWDSECARYRQVLESCIAAV